MAIDTLEMITSKKPMSTKQTTIFAVVGAILGIIIFIVAYASMSRHIWLDQYNQPLLDWMVGNRSAGITELSKIITNFAGTLSIILATIIIVGFWLAKKREVWRPLIFVVAMAIAAATSTLMKMLVMDARPPQVDMIPTFEIDFSFPSGHTLITIVFLLVLGYLLYSRRFIKSRLIAWLCVALTGSAVIALTRLYLGYHWLTDVIASVGLGFVILAVIIIIDKIGSSRTKLN